MAVGEEQCASALDPGGAAIEPRALRPVKLGPNYRGMVLRPSPFDAIWRLTRDMAEDRKTKTSAPDLATSTASDAGQVSARGGRTPASQLSDQGVAAS